MMYNSSMNDDFISTVSHELRTPLTSIKGFSETMLNSWEKLDDENKKKFLKIIIEQSNRLINLVENMLSVSKLQQTKEDLIYKDFSVKPVIEMTCAVIKNQYSDKNFEIIIDDKIPSILADKDKFQQIMTNLIENAAKYGDLNTKITIKSNYDDNFVSIKVINTGIEINKDDYEKIFTKFSRIDNPLTRKVQGSGLGLYITKNLVEKMGGNICVTSNDHTTTFEVKLPVSNIERQAKNAVSHADN